MCKRLLIFSVVSLLTVILIAIVTLWFPPAKRVVVSMSYASVTNKVTQWKPDSARQNAWPSEVRIAETVPGVIYYRSLFERGDPKFGPFTVVWVKKIDETHTSVEVSTTQHALLGLLGKRHLLFIERHRWKEIKQVLEKTT